jgi:hypothetical protein
MDPLPYYTISPNDHTHAVSLSGIYEFPFGKGKRFGASVPGLLDKFIAGWQLVSMYRWQTGDPLGFGDYILTSTGSQSQIEMYGSQRTVNEWFNTSAFDRKSGDQLSDELVCQPLRFSGIRADGMSFLDFSLMKKTVVLHERLSIDFRAEFLNSLNHPYFQDPNTTPTSSAFGEVTADVGFPRTIQFGLVGRF